MLAIPQTFCWTHRYQAEAFDVSARPYFEMAQLTRISAETYRAIAPAVKDGALHVDGEAIQLNAENSRRVADAVSRFRRAIPGRTASRNPIEDLRRRSIALVQEFEEIVRKERDGEKWAQLTATLQLLRSQLTRIAAENGVV